MIVFVWKAGWRRKMKLKLTNIPKKILKQITYIRGDGYKIIYKNGQLSPETYHSKVGAAAMIMGVWDLL